MSQEPISARRRRAAAARLRFWGVIAIGAGRVGTVILGAFVERLDERAADRLMAGVAERLPDYVRLGLSARA